MACVNIVGKKVLSGLLQTPTCRFSERICLVNHMSLYTSRNKSYSSDQNELPYSHDLQSREHEFSNVDRIGEASRVSSHNDQVRSGNAVSDRNNDCYQQISNVSLYSVMQTNVPHPYTSRPGHLNMPGGGIKLRDKYTSSFRHDVHPANGNFNGTKQFSTFSVLLSAKEDPFYSYGMRSEDMQGVQGPICSLENQTVGSLSQSDNPCPQGIQGSDCEKFKLWLENCTKYSYLNCDEQLQHLKEGRKTLAQIFEEQEKVIIEVAREYQTKHATHKVGTNYTNVRKAHNQTNNVSTDVRMSQKDRLKKAVSQYGATVVVFHIGISLISLGGFYLAVSSGIDIMAIVEKIGVDQKILQSKLASGATTFVAAYAVHKVFAPVRIAITLTCTPFIVRYLRAAGLLKAPKKV